MENICDEKILKNLEAYLAEYDKIFLVSGNENILNEMQEIFYKVGSLKNEKILLLTLQKININRNPFLVCQQITETEMDYIKKQYFMYEFSDRVLLISEDSRYGSLFNYVKTGLLAKEELCRILLE